ncbi:MAG: hypothetical protein DMD83_12320, partial [Candidatus Rokuibacteriota bacterium]
MKCPRCQAENAAGARFCEDGGARLEATCPSCGSPVTSGKKFCRSGGAAHLDLRRHAHAVALVQRERYRTAGVAPASPCEPESPGCSLAASAHSGSKSVTPLPVAM